MNDEYVSFWVNADPFGKQRPRSCAGGHRHYTPAKTVEYEELIRREFRKNHKGFTPYPRDVVLDMSITAYFAVPKSYSNKRREACLDGHEGVNKKPDSDNIFKIVADALNGVAYEDDKQIASIRVSKEWTGGDVGRIFVIIREKVDHYPQRNLLWTVM